MSTPSLRVCVFACTCGSHWRFCVFNLSSHLTICLRHAHSSADPKMSSDAPEAKGAEQTAHQARLAQLRAPGRYVPPQLRQKVQKDLTPEEFQKIKWTELARSIKGLVNKVSRATRIPSIFHESLPHTDLLSPPRPDPFSPRRRPTSRTLPRSRWAFSASTSCADEGCSAALWSRPNPSATPSPMSTRPWSP